MEEYKFTCNECLTDNTILFEGDDEGISLEHNINTCCECGSLLDNYEVTEEIFEARKETQTEAAIERAAENYFYG